MSDPLKLAPSPAPTGDARTERRRSDGEPSLFDDALSRAEADSPGEPSPPSSPPAGEAGREAPVAPDAETIDEVGDPIATVPVVVLPTDVPPLPPPVAAGLSAYAIKPPAPQAEVAAPPSTNQDDGVAAPSPTTSPAVAPPPPTADLITPSSSVDVVPPSAPPPASPKSIGGTEEAEPLIPSPTTRPARGPAAASLNETPTPDASATVEVEVEDASPPLPDSDGGGVDGFRPAPAPPVSTGNGDVAATARTTAVETAGLVPAAEKAIATPPATAAEHPPPHGRVSTGVRPERLGATVVRLASLGGGEYRVDLDPPELGRVRVEAEVSEGRVTLSITADRPETLTLLRNDASSLRAALANAGFETGSGDVRFSLSDGGRSDHQGAAERNPRGDRSNDGEKENAAPVPPAERVRIAVDGRVDVSV